MPATTATPQVSVALCTYNGAAYLREQLDSVLAQRDVDLEVVALDDGSSDGTVAILDDYARRDARLRWQRNERNLGPTASFERALSLCRGDLLAPCDQDDIWLPGKLARLVAAIGSADLAYCDSAYVDADDRTLGRRVSDGGVMLAGRAPVSFLFSNTVSGHASLLRRDLFEAVRPFPAGAYHDWWLALCAAGRNGVVYVDAPLVRYRRHGAAFSPMGASAPPPRDAASSRLWLEHRLRLMRAYPHTGLRDAAAASELAVSLQRALDTGHVLPMLPLLWRHRRALPPWKGSPWVDALKWQSRLAKKIRRARREESPDAATGGPSP